MSISGGSWTLAPEKPRLEAESGNMQGLVENKNKYEINKHTEMENEFVLIRKDVGEAYVSRVQLESHLEGLTSCSAAHGQLFPGPGQHHGQG